jgi:ATP-dependent Clp protease adaptor protein ClpS
VADGNCQLLALSKIAGQGKKYRYNEAMSESQDQQSEGLATETARPKLKEPPRYKVIMLNDDYTPMEFVVQVLQQFFRHSREKAVQIMMQVHTQGRSVAGVFPAEIAETKVAQVNEYARRHQHPLLTVMEEA